MIGPAILAGDVAVAGQIGLADLPHLAQRYRTIINNRPDGEEPGQPTSAELEAAASKLGLCYVHIPVVSGSIGDDQVSDFAAALAERPGPTLAFCRTGTRSAKLWALSHAGKRRVADILAAAAKAGYGLASLELDLQQAAHAK